MQPPLLLLIFVAGSLRAPEIRCSRDIRTELKEEAAFLQELLVQRKACYEEAATPRPWLTKQVPKLIWSPYVREHRHFDWSGCPRTVWMLILLHIHRRIYSMAH